MLLKVGFGDFFSIPTLLLIIWKYLLLRYNLEIQRKVMKSLRAGFHKMPILN